MRIESTRMNRGAFVDVEISTNHGHLEYTLAPSEMQETADQVAYFLQDIYESMKMDEHQVKQHLMHCGVIDYDKLKQARL